MAKSNYCFNYDFPSPVNQHRTIISPEPPACLNTSPAYSNQHGSVHGWQCIVSPQRKTCCAMDILSQGMPSIKADSLWNSASVIKPCVQCISYTPIIGIHGSACQYSLMGGTIWNKGIGRKNNGCFKSCLSVAMVPGKAKQKVTIFSFSVLHPLESMGTIMMQLYIWPQDHVLYQVTAPQNPNCWIILLFPNGKEAKKTQVCVNRLWL